MASTQTFVIVGGGLAGAKAAEALRDNDFDGHIILFAEERHLPYERPPLSKEYLAGKKSLNDFTVQDADWYGDHNVDLRLGSRVSSLDPAAHTVGLPDDLTVAYDDAATLNSVLTEGSSLAVVGAGWIGLEVAAGARQRGVGVTVVEAARQPLVAALGETVGEVFANL